MKKFNRSSNGEYKNNHILESNQIEINEAMSSCRCWKISFHGKLLIGFQRIWLLSLQRSLLAAVASLVVMRTCTITQIN